MFKKHKQTIDVTEDHSYYNSRAPGYHLVSVAVLFKQIRREIANVTLKHIFPFLNVCENPITPSVLLAAHFQLFVLLKLEFLN